MPVSPTLVLISKMFSKNGLESPLEGSGRDLIKALSFNLSRITGKNYENPDLG
jgi:hypothetical protein